MLMQAFCLGFCSCLFQLFVLRELMAALGGNELVYMLCLAGWMAGIACGSIWLKSSSALLFGLAAVLAPVTALAATGVRFGLGLMPGQLPDPLISALVAFFLVLPVSVVFGAAFSALTREVKGRVMSLYAQEALGFVVAGVGATFLFFPFMRSWDIVALVCLPAIIIYFKGEGVLVFKFLPAVVMLCFFVGDYGEKTASFIRAASWKGFRIVAEKDTVYGRNLLLERNGSLSYFENGRFSAAEADVASAEEAVHYALLAHSDPKRLLVLGGTLAAGREREALKHPGLAVDRTEVDTQTVAFLVREMHSVRQVLQTSRLRVLRTDGRAYLKRVRGLYDVIIVDAGDPLTLLQNRFYTREFFEEAAQALAEGGVLALTMASAENYINEEGRQVLRSLFTTLKGVFPEVRFLPGPRTLFLGVRSPGTVSLDPLVLERRLRARGVRTTTVKPGYWDERFDLPRLAGFEQLLATPGEVNRDLRPILYVSSLSFWSTHFSSLFSRFMQLAGYGLPCLWFLVIYVFIFGLKPGISLSLATAMAGGFQLMIIKSSVMVVFQALFGYIYSWFGLITAVFLAGVCVGSWLAENRKITVSWIILALAAVVSFAGAVVLPFLATCGIGWFSLAGLFIFAFCAGAVGGGQFAAAVFTGAEPGRLYAADIAGSVLGFVLGGVALVPLWGSRDALMFCALLQLALMTVFIRQDRRCCGKRELL